MQSLSFADYKKIVNEYFAPNPWIYWGNLLASAVVGYGSLVLAEQFPAGSLPYLFSSFVAVFALYRGMLFIHELTHRERADMPGFSIAWNLIFGVPFLLPSFMYRGVHIDHHKRNYYSTDEDGEYLPLGASPIGKTVAYVAQSFVLAPLVLIRFSLLTPVSLLHPKLRHLIMTRASALAIRTDVPRRLPTGAELQRWYVLEALCFAYSWLLIAVFAAGLLNLGTLFHLYWVTVAMFLVNSVRTIVAHRYRNASGREVSFEEQLLDSVNFEGNWLVAELVAPVGLRYHALHHLFATLPYHNLGHAHRKLTAQLPKDAIYHQVTEPSLAAALVTLWRNTKTAPEAAPALKASGT